MAEIGDESLYEEPIISLPNIKYGHIYASDKK